MNTRPDSEKRFAATAMSLAEGQHGVDDPILALARQAMAKVVSETRAAVAGQQATGQIPSPHISELANALADTDRSLAETRIADLLRSGVGIQDLCIDHLTPAARELGARWERDTMHFADVTMATARIQSILRTIPSIRDTRAGAPEHRAIFAVVPGEDHTLGIIMAADHFRRLGWDIGLRIGMGHGELCQSIENDDRSVIALSCAGRHSSGALLTLVDEIRHRRPDVRIALCGNVLNDQVAMQTSPTVDGVIDELVTAERVLEGLLLPQRVDA